MPLAIQYGMSEYQFWHGDVRLLSIYQKAYIRNQSYTAWWQGQYSCVAFGIVLENAFKKKGAKAESYPEYKDAFEKFERKKLTKEEKEKQFRDMQIQQSNWINYILKK